jgi:hypothetical protein
MAVPEARQFLGRFLTLPLRIVRPTDYRRLDRPSERDRPALVDYMPASSLYHLFVAATEIERGFRF